ncbi:MAG: hypothetical protein AB3N14_20100, partial [Flavobacteriaceae bacterium]
ALTGCIGAIVATSCAVNIGERNMSTKHYEYQIRLTTADGEISKTGDLECTPTEYLCGGGNWYAKFPESDTQLIEIQIDNDRKLNFHPPECASYSKLNNIHQEVPYPRAPEPTLHTNVDSYSIHLTDLRKQSALQLYGVRLESLTMKKIATE